LPGLSMIGSPGTGASSGMMAAEICRRVSNGETLQEVCRTPGMPPSSTVRWWYIRDLEGSRHYTRRRDNRRLKRGPMTSLPLVRTGTASPMTAASGSIPNDG
jgi:hypothetical protein